MAHVVLVHQPFGEPEDPPDRVLRLGAANRRTLTIVVDHQLVATVLYLQLTNPTDRFVRRPQVSLVHVSTDIFTNGTVFAHLAPVVHRVEMSSWKVVLFSLVSYLKFYVKLYEVF